MKTTKITRSATLRTTIKPGAYRVALLALGSLGILTFASCAYDPYYGGGHHNGGGGYRTTSYGYSSGYGNRHSSHNSHRSQGHQGNYHQPSRNSGDHGRGDSRGRRH